MAEEEGSWVAKAWIEKTRSGKSFEVRARGGFLVGYISKAALERLLKGEIQEAASRIFERKQEKT